MSTPNAPSPTAELFDLRRRSLEESTQAWLRAVGQTRLVPPATGAALAELWRPLLSQGMELWQKAAAQGGAHARVLDAVESSHGPVG
jgi:hypothetical protein